MGGRFGGAVTVWEDASRKVSGLIGREIAYWEFVSGFIVSDIIYTKSLLERAGAFYLLQSGSETAQKTRCVWGQWSGMRSQAPFCQGYKSNHV
jgi:hypothetical protein